MHVYAPSKSIRVFLTLPSFIKFVPHILYVEYLSEEKTEFMGSEERRVQRGVYISVFNITCT